MAVRTYETLKQYHPKSVTNLQKSLFMEATVDTDDTITVGELTTVTAASAYKVSDGDVVAVSVADNIVTVDESALTDVDIVLLVIGS